MKLQYYAWLRDSMGCDSEQIVLPGMLAVFAGSGVVLTGRQLAVHGVQLPRLHPESGILLHLRAP